MSIRRSPSIPITPASIDDTTSQIGTTPPTSPSPSERRWSDVIPPKTALTFAVVWDPKEEMVAFSGAELLDDSRTEDAFISPSDACSQVLTVGRSTLPLSENTATMQFFRDNYEFLFVEPATPDRLQLGRTQTSSTMGELDVYLRGSLMGKAHHNNRYYSCLENLDGNFEFDPRTSFARIWFRKQEGSEAKEDTVSDEGFFEVTVARQPPGQHVSSDRSRASICSASTTATSDFVSIESDDAFSVWSTLDAPESPTYTHFLSNDQQRPRKKRLRKARPAEMPAPPSEVLRREVFSHQVSLPPPPRPHYSHVNSQARCISLTKFVKGLAKKNKVVPGERWVCIEITQEVRQQHI